MILEARVVRLEQNYVKVQIIGSNKMMNIPKPKRPALKNHGYEHANTQRSDCSFIYNCLLPNEKVFVVPQPEGSRFNLEGELVTSFDNGFGKEWYLQHMFGNTPVRTGTPYKRLLLKSIGYRC